jgi:hypothetical protein
MSHEGTKPTYPKTKVPDPDRCLFTSSHGQRCLNPHMGATNKFCMVHERHVEKINDAELQSISDELFSGGPALGTREELGRVMAKLFTLIAQKRVSRHDGALLAYVASLLLQTMLPTAVPEEPPVRVIWDIPMTGPSQPDEQPGRGYSDLQFPDGT